MISVLRLYPTVVLVVLLILAESVLISYAMNLTQIIAASVLMFALVAAAAIFIWFVPVQTWEIVRQVCACAREMFEFNARCWG